MLLNNQWINEETKEEIKKYLGKWKWKNSSPKPRRWSKSSSKREVYSNTILTQEKKNLKQPNLTSKTTRESRTNKT